MFMSDKSLSVLKVVLRYFLAALLGWLEGDSHTAYDLIVSLLSF